jgi:type II secretory pathway pseudopilin PulG
VRLTVTGPKRPARRIAAGEDGFTMIFALVALLISGLLVASAFTAASGDISLSRNFTLQTKAYYAAQAGVQRFQHELSTNPNYWVQCESIGGEEESRRIKVPATTDETYYVKPLGSAGHTACEKEKQLTILETTGAAKGTFRVLSMGYAGSGKSAIKRMIVATFAHPGFTKYVYESNYEVEDPSNFEPEPTGCEHYYKYRVEHRLTGVCPPIQFAPTDKVNGPMHTNDAAAVCSTGSSAPTFGRNSEDPIEMNGGHYAASGCGNSPNIVGKYTETAGSLLPPETDAELLETAGLKFSGRTELTLAAGSPNTITATVINSKNEKETLPTKTFPTNGVIYVENSSSGCGVAKYTPFGSDTEHDTGCGNVYVHGEYTESLTIASADDVIVNGNLTTTSEEGGAPTGGATLGLIAQNFVRVYHPVKKGYSTPHVAPAISPEPPVNSKCVSTKELSARIHGTTELSEITTTGLTVGTELEGTVAGQIESGTVISAIKASENKVTLSKETTPKAKELSAKILRSTEISEVTTTGLTVGDEVAGTVAGQTETGTVITEIKASEKKLKLSKATKTPVTELTGTIKSGSAEITAITPTGIAVGEEVEGPSTQFEAGTIITEINTSKKTVKLSKNAKKSETLKLKFYGEATKLKFYGETTKIKFLVPTGYAYNSTLGNCHKVETGYDRFIEAENLYVKNCESETTYISNAFCEYENNSEGCSSKATNLNATEDPNHWGSLSEPVIDAAILSTKHSWIVDNYKCGASLGKLTVWGSIAQFWRGPVGTSGEGGTGYIKNYNYDERLAAQQPPSFLSPSSTSWKLSRETAPPTSFTG